MIPAIIVALEKAYRESGQDKERFFILIFKKTGLKKPAFVRGVLADHIKTLTWRK